MALTKEDLKSIKKIVKEDQDKHEIQIKRYMKMLSEDFQSKVKVIGEQCLLIEEKLNATFELAVQTKEELELVKIDIGMMKQDIKEMKQDIKDLKRSDEIMMRDIKDLKNDVKDLKKSDAVMNKNIVEIKKKLDYKADLEALNELEDRVVLLERKFATA